MQLTVLNVFFMCVFHEGPALPVGRRDYRTSLAFSWSSFYCDDFFPRFLWLLRMRLNEDVSRAKMCFFRNAFQYDCPQSCPVSTALAVISLY